MSTTLVRPPVLHGAARLLVLGLVDRPEDPLGARRRSTSCDDGVFRALAAGTGLPAIHQRSTFPFHNVKDGADRFLGMSKGGERPYARIYTRLGNPTTEYLERVLFRLEAQHVIEKALAEDETEPTIGCLIFGSGMGAISTLLLSLLKAGDAVLAGNIYGCTDSLLRDLSKFGVERGLLRHGRPRRTSKPTLDAHPNVAAVFLESPENPTLRLADIEAISRLTEARGIPLVVDNTFCSPYLQQPFRLGADFVVHSLTKFINGHSTSVGGALLGPFRFMKDDLFPWYKDLGATPVAVRLVAELDDGPVASPSGRTRSARAPRRSPRSSGPTRRSRASPTPASPTSRRRDREEADAQRRLAHQLRGEGRRGRRREADELLRPEGHADGAGREPRGGDHATSSTRRR